MQKLQFIFFLLWVAEYKKNKPIAKYVYACNTHEHQHFCTSENECINCLRMLQFFVSCILHTLSYSMKYNTEHNLKEMLFCILLKIETYEKLLRVSKANSKLHAAFFLSAFNNWIMYKNYEHHEFSQFIFWRFKG